MRNAVTLVRAIVGHTFIVRESASAAKLWRSCADADSLCAMQYALSRVRTGARPLGR